MVRSIENVQREFSEDFTIVNGNLLLCKFCDSVVRWRKRTRVVEHLSTKMHAEKKEAKMRKFMAELAATPNDEDDLDADEDGGGWGGVYDDLGSSSGQQNQYCLKWNNHRNNLLNVVNRLLGDEQFTDVLLAAEGRKIRAHKVVLSSCSSYFENLFMTFDEKNQIIILKDTPFKDIYNIIEFVYKGEINVQQDELPSLLKTAESLHIKGLSEPSSMENFYGNNNITIPFTTPRRPQSPSDGGGGMSGGCYKTGAPPARLSLEPASSNKDNSGATSTQVKGCPNAASGDRNDAADLSGGEPVKRKRGRPRIFDTGEDITTVYSDSAIDDKNWFKLTATTNNGGHSAASEVGCSSVAGAPPLPSLTEERIHELGVMKMNDYLSQGTRPQFWEEHFVKVIMQSVKNKEIDMKGAAELLGVSYGTLYGRYRELFGYVKHAWNNGSGGGRPSPGKFVAPQLSAASVGSKSCGGRASDSVFAVDPSNKRQILELVRNGHISIREAADYLSLDPNVLRNQLTGKCHDSPEKLAKLLVGDEEEGEKENVGVGCGDDEEEGGVTANPEDEDGDFDCMDVQQDSIVFNDDLSDTNTSAIQVAKSSDNEDDEAMEEQRASDVNNIKKEIINV